MSEMLSDRYNPTDVEAKTYTWWKQKGYFKADDKSTKVPFSIILPPPNVTGFLHMGHALDHTIQDVMIRWKRMSGFNTLWLPGTDHAGIATQAVVEKLLHKETKKTRHDFGREDDALGGGSGAALGQLRHAVDAVGGPHQELP